MLASVKTCAKLFILYFYIVACEGHVGIVLVIWSCIKHLTCEQCYQLQLIVHFHLNKADPPWFRIIHEIFLSAVGYVVMRGFLNGSLRYSEEDCSFNQNRFPILTLSQCIEK